ncbi:hypothetical protein B5S31_g2811 [[Candida] boidinii]|nr:hypothetical protein B5S31_g2811 [[Candida] boidinii]
MSKDQASVLTKSINEDSNVESSIDFNGAELQPLKKWRWNSPFVQCLYAGFLVALTAGLYVTVTGLGAGGGKSSSERVNAISTSLGDGLWVFSALASGTLINVYGPRVCCMIGASGYPFYIAGFWVYDKTGIAAIPIICGVISGLTCGFLWGAQMWIVATYAKENEKGKYVAWNHIMFVLGGTAGCIITTCISKDLKKGNQGVYWYIYLIFVMITASAVAFAYFLEDPKKIRRDDGTKIAIFKARTIKEELTSLVDAFTHKRIILMMIPLFTCQIMFSLYSSLNSHIFSTRARALNNLFYWFAQVPASFLFEFLADYKGLSRKTRGYLALGATATVVFSGLMGVSIMMGKWGLSDFSRSVTLGIDWSETKYAGLFIWYFVCGISYGMMMSLRIWIISSFSNNPQQQSSYSGIIVTFQAAGISIAFGLNAAGVAYEKLLIVWWVLYGTSMICMACAIKFFVTDTDYGKEENVIVPLEARNEIEQSHLDTTISVTGDNEDTK